MSRQARTLPVRGIFISHAQSDAKLAAQLKLWLEQCFPRVVKVFVSSDWASVRMGTNWYSEVIQALKESALGLVLLTENSGGRPWINFEFGGLTLLGKKAVPVCVGSIQLADLHPPLSVQQACKYELAEHRLALLRSIASELFDWPPELAEQWLSPDKARNAPVLEVTKPESPGPVLRRATIRDLFHTQDRWATVIYTCRATFTGETCPDDQGEPPIRKALVAHWPVDELRTACLVLDHFFPSGIRTHEDDIRETVVCSKQAMKFATAECGSARHSIPELLDRDVIVIGENKISDLLLNAMQPYLPWRSHRAWESPDPGKPGRPRITVRLTPRWDLNILPGQKREVDRTGGMLATFPSPFNVRKRVMVLFGCHREGQFTLEDWLQSDNAVATAATLTESLANHSEESVAVQIVVDRAGEAPASGFMTHAGTGAVANFSRNAEPLWLTVLNRRKPEERVRVDPHFSHRGPMHDISLLAVLDRASQEKLKAAALSLIGTPNLYWEDEQQDSVGFHITLYEFCTHAAPGEERTAELDRLAGSLASSLAGQQELHAPTATRATVYGIELMPTGVICYVRFPYEEFGVNWLERVRIWAEHSAEHAVHGGSARDLLNSMHVPFPPHITLARFDRELDPAVLARIRENANRTRHRQTMALDIAGLSLAVARRRPYNEVEVASRYCLHP